MEHAELPTDHTQYDEFPPFAALFSKCPALWHNSWGCEGYQADLKEAKALLEELS